MDGCLRKGRLPFGVRVPEDVAQPINCQSPATHFRPSRHAIDLNLMIEPSGAVAVEPDFGPRAYQASAFAANAIATLNSHLGLSYGNPNCYSKLHRLSYAACFMHYSW